MFLLACIDDLRSARSELTNIDRALLRRLLARLRDPADADWEIHNQDESNRALAAAEFLAR